MTETEFEQFEQIDNLMVSPVADIRPRVLGFNHFVVNAFVRDAVGVISVRGSGIEELSDDMIDEQGIGIGQCFPVLEDIAPVALVGHDGLTVFVLHAYVEEVPRSGGVTVTTAES